MFIGGVFDFFCPACYNEFMLFTLLIFVAILALLVLVHEFGHFIVARKNGVKVEEFGFGFPPRIFGVQILKGEWRWVWGGGRHLEKADEEWLAAGTVYSLNWIPLGGFVKIKGETGEFASESDSFSFKPAGRRAWILAAGVLMNFVLAGLLLSLGFGLGLPQSLDEVGWGARVKDAKVEILDVLEGTPAARAGVLPGDAIVKVDNLAGLKLSQIQQYTDEKTGQAVKFVFSREGQPIEKTIIPIVQAQTKKGGIGVALLESGVVSYPWYLTLYRGFQTMGLYTWEVLKAFWFLLAGIFQGAGVTENLSGPVGIAVLTGRVARLGFIHLLQFTALLSINLAVINFLPFPALDGGRILFLIIEKFRGRPVRQKIENIIHTVGFALLLTLVVFVTYKDIIRFSGSFIRIGKKIIGG